MEACPNHFEVVLFLDGGGGKSLSRSKRTIVIMVDVESILRCPCP